MKKTTIILILVLVISFILATVVESGGYMEPVSRGYVINNFCMKNGVCTFDYLTVYNLSVIGQVFNVTMNLVTWNITENFNVGGNLEAKNITALDKFIGDGSLITGIVASSVEDTWVNESGDTMTGGLVVNDWVNASNSTGQLLVMGGNHLMVQP